MHDGWEYVAATYGVTALTLGAWFWMILAKLRRLRDAAPRSEETRG
jgi:hypothetical protein